MGRREEEDMLLSLSGWTAGTIGFLAVVLLILAVGIPQVVAEFSDGQPPRTGKGDNGLVIAIPVHLEKLWLRPVIILL
jgi:hypothetical protein